MKKLTSDKIFSLFEKMDEEVLTQEGFEDLLNEDSTLLGMVVKGVENYSFIHEIYLNRYGERYEELAEGVKLQYFDKLFSYLQKLKLNKLEVLLDLIEVIGEGTIYRSLQDLSTHFQDLEEYEKCAKIKKIVDILKYFEKN